MAINKIVKNSLGADASSSNSQAGTNGGKGVVIVRY